MPTVLTFSGLRVLIPTNAAAPPHVHVVGPGCEASFVLHGAEDPVELLENHFFPQSRLSYIANTLDAHLPLLMASWRTLHGTH